MAIGSYPVFLELRGRACVVVGGGAIAERKVAGLRKAGALVTVVAPSLTRGLATLARTGRIRHVARAFRPDDLADAHLAVAAVNDRQVSAEISAEARQRRVWLNAADEPERCDFILPAVLRRGPLTIAVASGGTSPALSRVVRDWLEAELPADLSLLAAATASVRRRLRASGRSPAPAAWRAALELEIRTRLTRSLEMAGDQGGPP
jgi:siroheme synthase-like protein